ncbi:hypothetical protein [Nisaea sp.]|uniref:hypothetical protein n=1 Tax=Nisaea sp. TaxID=2024842 RepID=UPI0032EDAE7D
MYVKNCIYCGSTDLNAEHVFGDWLKNFLPRKNKKRAVAFFRGGKKDNKPQPTSMNVINPRNSPLVSWKIRCVCKTCNSGWMGDVQENAKLVVGPMTNGKSILLDHASKAAIAAWATSVAVTVEYDRHHAPAITPEQRSAFREKKLAPDTFKIWIGKYDCPDDRSVFAKSTHSIYTEAEILADPNKDPTIQNTQTCAFGVGKLYVLVFSSPHHEMLDMVRIKPKAAAVLDQIWPPSPGTLWWPKRAMTDSDAYSIATALRREILKITQN